ncbi:MAG TPA: ferrochelatase [Candidatus Omnitrophica bacterium]|nr:ferrochelatase [Candidatus Omnitrophota bacterium]
MKNFDHILLIGFGGPETPEDVVPFLKRVTAGRKIPEQRLLAVAHHYEMIGGVSPYNPWASSLQIQIKDALKSKLPVFLGHRNTAPFLKDQVLEIHRRGFKKGIGVVLAPFRSTASCRRYKENIHEALHEHGITELQYLYLDPWYRDSKWIDLLASLARQTFESIPLALREQTEILFSCHSIPSVADSACSSCIYSAEYETASNLTAQAAGFKSWKHVYQSRSGDPSQPWLGPDILDAMKQAAQEGKKALLVIPMGFLSDNAEVLYDLDIEAKNLAAEIGIEFFRASTPGNDPRLADLFARLIERKAAHPNAGAGCVI